MNYFFIKSEYEMQKNVKLYNLHDNIPESLYKDDYDLLEELKD